jgi:hypothetical protein
MSRKPAKPARASQQRAQRVPTSPASPIRLPRSTRTVTARALRPRAGDARTRTRREVPEIRLSGAWLERIGFAKGAEYLISVEREFRTIILQGAFRKSRSR